MKDMFSLIQWNENISQAPVEQDLLVIYRDDTGDRVNYYTYSAWRLYNSYFFISNNEQICTNNIVAWALMPTYYNMKVFE